MGVINPGGSSGGTIGSATGGASGSVLFVDPSGDLGEDNSNFFWDDTNNRLGVGTLSPSSKLDIILASASEKGSITKAAGSQTANLHEWQNSSGTVLNRIGSDGKQYIGSGQTDGGTGANLSVASSGIYTPGWIWATSGLKLTSANTIVIGDVANSVKFTGSAGLQFITGGGYLRYNSSVGFTVYKADGTTKGLMDVGNVISTAGTAATIPMLVKAAASQTANLQEWQNSSGTILAAIRSGGALQLPIETVTGTTDTLDNTNHTVLCDCTSNAITINLPAASTSSGLIYNIKKIDSSVNAVTVDGSGSETIDGATTATISTQYSSITIQCNGTNWFIL